MALTWQYFPPSSKLRMIAALEVAGVKLVRTETAVAYVEIENIVKQFLCFFWFFGILVWVMWKEIVMLLSIMVSYYYDPVFFPPLCTVKELLKEYKQRFYILNSIFNTVAFIPYKLKCFCVNYRKAELNIEKSLSLVDF